MTTLKHLQSLSLKSNFIDPLGADSVSSLMVSCCSYSLEFPPARQCLTCLLCITF